MPKKDKYDEDEFEEDSDKDEEDDFEEDEDY